MTKLIVAFRNFAKAPNNEFRKKKSMENLIFAACLVCICYTIYKEPLPILHRCFITLYQYGQSLLSQRSYRLFKY